MNNLGEHQIHPETNGDPDTLVDEATELLVVESESGWRVMIEHIGSDNLIQISFSSHQEAVALVDQIEASLANGTGHIRPADGHLISLVGLRQVWIDETRSSTLTATEQGI